MAVEILDAEMLRSMFLAGAQNIEAHKEEINELNVFPVPDGDTGTNMTLTIMSAAREIQMIEDLNMETLCKAISGGSLRGARGNSGVILSQLLRGFTKGIRESETVNTAVLTLAFRRAVDTAYKAVMKPKEGTILTVARGGAEKAEEIAGSVTDIVEFAKTVIDAMDAVLANTPELLPVLKEAGVVDSGGKGLVTVLRGAESVLNGAVPDLSKVGISTGTKPQTEEKTESAAPAGKKREAISTDEIKFGYCTEFIIKLKRELTEKEDSRIKAFLESIGDSIVCVSDGEIVKIHVHTNDPGAALSMAVKYGALSRMKIDNMREEHEEVLGLTEAAAQTAKSSEQKEEKPRKQFGFISVATGAGLAEIFRGIGCDFIIEGGQTMNPSTDDMLAAIEEVNADTIFILPNNKNIILAAQQAAALCKEKEIIVIPSRTIPQGITAMINFLADKTAADNTETMTAEMQKVKTGEVTYAVRDTKVDGKAIHSGDIMGISDKTIESVGTDIAGVTLDLVSRLMEDDAELISLYYGEETKEEDAKALADQLAEQYPDVDIEVHSGGQPIYYYILSVE